MSDPTEGMPEWLAINQDRLMENITVAHRARKLADASPGTAQAALAYSKLQDSIDTLEKRLIAIELGTLIEETDPLDVVHVHETVASAMGNVLRYAALVSVCAYGSEDYFAALDFLDDAIVGLDAVVEARCGGEAA